MNKKFYRGAAEKKRGGFTLIELLVVVLIIGILASIAVSQYQKAVDKSRTAELFLLVKAAANAMAMYELETRSKTSNWSELDFELPGAVLSSSNATANLNVIQNSKVAGFLYTFKDISQVYIISFSSKQISGLSIAYNYPVTTYANSDCNPKKKAAFFTCGGKNERSKNACKSLGAIQSAHDDTTFCLNM